MPIGSINNNVTLPTPVGRSAIARTPVIEIDDQLDEQQKNNRLLSDSPDLASNAEISDRVVQANATENIIFQSVPSFDEFPTSQRNALQLYLSTQNTVDQNQDPRQAIVGVDTFV